MARIKTMDGGDRAVVLDYLFPITGRQACTGATCAVALTSIAATDIVLCQAEACATVTSYILYTTITAGTGFVVTMVDPGSCTINWAVFHPNKA